MEYLYSNFNKIKARNKPRKKETKMKKNLAVATKEIKRERF